MAGRITTPCMPSPEKNIFTTEVDNDLLKNFKKLVIDFERPMNGMLEEAVVDRLKKYGAKDHFQQISYFGGRTYDRSGTSICCQL